MIPFLGLLAGACVDLRYPPGADGGQVVAYKKNGVACQKGGECQSGACVDDVCCMSTCEGKCNTCRKPGSEGRCVLADEGTNPRSLCVKDANDPCGELDSCNAAGSCQKHTVGEACRPASCRVRNVMLAARCNAAGVCEEPALQSCAPYFCSEGADMCLTSCTKDLECTNGPCIMGTCGKKPLGSACGNKDECDSGLCQTGVCCQTTCGGCKSCALPGSAGTCTNIPAGMAATPELPCPSMEAATCKFDGLCDGAGACRQHPAGKVCNPASCTNAALRNAATCDGKGTCQVPPTVTCGGYTCGTTTSCRTTCMADADCASPSVCGKNERACGGLSAQYFRQTNLTDLAFMRTDPTIDFNFGGGSPSALLNVDNFSVRWRGKLTPRFSETYTFYVGSDDGEKLWVNGMLIIDRFIRHASVPEDVSKTVVLQAGLPVDIQMEFFENGGDASVQLLWRSQSEPKAVVPTSALSPQ